MNTETAANPADAGPVTLVDAVEAAGNQAAQTEANTNAGEAVASIEDLTKEALGETGATPEDEIEIEYEGEKRKLPPKWKDAFLRHQDYTRKTMELGDQRKALDTERQTFQANAATIGQEFQAHTQLGALNLRIQELERTDTTYWTDDEIRAGTAQLNQLRQQAAGITQFIQQQHAARNQNAQQARQRCLTEAAVRVPNFSDARRAELENLAVSIGAEAAEVASMTDPWAYEILHFADIGKKFIERQRKAAQMRTAQAGSPATMLGSAASGGKAPEDMSMDEYAAWRNAGNG